MQQGMPNGLSLLEAENDSLSKISIRKMLSGVKDYSGKPYFSIAQKEKSTALVQSITRDTRVGFALKSALSNTSIKTEQDLIKFWMAIAQ